MQRLVSHGFLLGGYLVMVLLARPRCAPAGHQPGNAGRNRHAGGPADEADQPAPLRLLPPQPYSAQARDRRAA